MIWLSPGQQKTFGNVTRITTPHPVFSYLWIGDTCLCARTELIRNSGLAVGDRVEVVLERGFVTTIYKLEKWSPAGAGRKESQ